MKSISPFLLLPAVKTGGKQSRRTPTAIYAEEKNNKKYRLFSAKKFKEALWLFFLEMNTSKKQFKIK